MLSACIGGDYKLSPRTVWLDTKQVIEDWDNPPEINFDANSDLWQSLLREQALFARDPDVAFSITDIGGILAVVASLRGTQNLLYDLYDYPDELKEFAALVKAVWFDVFDQQVKTLKDVGLPYNSWMYIPSAKPWYPLQCDFCYMISPAQFEEFVLADLVDQVNHMDRSIYHLDGVGELNHLDMILDIPNLTGIQWTPGAGCEPLWDEKWFPLYRKIQDKNKNLVLLGGISEGDMQGAERLIKTLDPKGFYIKCWCSSREKGEWMVDQITKWSE
jgi:5-methyltetrahydrofolate--homocysteine methyltransferase